MELVEVRVDYCRIRLPFRDQFLQGAGVVHGGVAAEGWIRKRGRSVVFCDAQVHGTDGRAVASATLIYKISSRSAD